MNTIGRPVVKRVLLGHPYTTIAVCGVLGVGVVLIGIHVFDAERSLGDFIYDAGVGALIATALGALVAFRMGEYERAQDEAREAQERRQEQQHAEIERLEKERDERLRARVRQLDDSLKDAQRMLDEANAYAKEALAESRLDSLELTIAGLKDDLEFTRDYVIETNHLVKKLSADEHSRAP